MLDEARAITRSVRTTTETLARSNLEVDLFRAMQKVIASLVVTTTTATAGTMAASVTSLATSLAGLKSSNQSKAFTEEENAAIDRRGISFGCVSPWTTPVKRKAQNMPAS